MYINDPINSTRKLQQFRSNLNKIIEYKLNTQKSAAFLYKKDKETQKKAEKQYFSQ